MLFTGLMLTQSGPKVLEYNTRCGDPETQSMVPLLSEDIDLTDVLLACTQGRLNQVNIGIRPGFACNVVIAAGGYPESYRQGDPIEFGEAPAGKKNSLRRLEVELTRKLFRGMEQSLLMERPEQPAARVLTVVSVAESLQGAVAAAYEGVNSIKFHNMYYRRDIASR